MKNFKPKFTFDPKYKKAVAYFSSEFAIDQSLKIYSGGLGFLSGSHMRSAYDLQQNLIGIGILWKYGYYDQVRKGDKSMDVLFQEKLYSFLEDTGIRFDLNVNNHPVKVKALYLSPEIFGSAPMFLLSTDVPENDYLAQSITHRLYDSNLATRIAQYMILGIGGAKLLDLLGLEPEVYHFNEAHALSAAFYLYDKFNDLDEVKNRMVFTTHTPEKAGNEEHQVSLLYKMGFFYGLPLEVVKEISQLDNDNFNHTLVALRLAKIANGVSKKHGEVSREMWAPYEGACPIISITNAQNKRYWADRKLQDALEENDNEGLVDRKKYLKRRFFKTVADQTGKILDPEVLTIVWARRFAEYKRADLIISDEERFHALVTNKDHPIQIIWAGKPYPGDLNAVGTFNNLVHMNKNYMSSASLVGYELNLSQLAKQGSDIWLNNPRIPREASGTSGMTAAMNGSVNFSTNDGWVLEFAKDKTNSFVIPMVDTSLPVHEQDRLDAEHLYSILENEIIPMYYNQQDKWVEIVKSSMKDVVPFFDSDRMAHEYYEKLYHYQEIKTAILSTT